MMKRLLTALSVGHRRSMVIGALSLVGLFLFTHVLPRSSGADPAAIVVAIGSGQPGNAVSNALSTTLLAAPQKMAWPAPAKVMGMKACINCHRSEYLAWRPTKHYTSMATIAGTGGNIAKYAEALGIKEAGVMHNVLCANCHGLPQANREGKIRSISGVSCESCHGAAGGEGGWLNRHAVYGPNVTRIDQETAEHRKSRIGYCENADMVRAANLYSIAKNCFQCHSVTNEKLVNAGHKIGKHLELLGWSTGEVRHNFHEDQAVNGKGPSLWSRMNGGNTMQRRREKFIVGILVDLEVSLRALASATDGDGEFVEGYQERVTELQEDFLEEIVEALDDDAPESLSDLAETIGDLENDDADYGEEDARKAAADAAEKVAAVAKAIASGKDLKLDGVDEIMNETAEARGKVFSRK